MSQPWTTLFTFNRQILLGKNLDGIDQALADRAPAEGVHSYTWILGHVLNTRRWMLGAVLNSSYAPSTAEPKTLPELLAAMDEAHEAMAAAFDGVKDWNAQQTHPVMQTPAPLQEIVGTFFMHESYHLGQLGVARKLMGLPGALKNPTEKAMV